MLRSNMKRIGQLKEDDGAGGCVLVFVNKDTRTIPEHVQTAVIGSCMVEVTRAKEDLTLRDEMSVDASASAGQITLSALSTAAASSFMEIKEERATVSDWTMERLR
jgi:hypothetical protein